MRVGCEQDKAIVVHKVRCAGTPGEETVVGILVQLLSAKEKLQKVCGWVLRNSICIALVTVLMASKFNNNKNNNNKNENTTTTMETTATMKTTTT